jgi:hypothetical protein
MDPSGGWGALTLPSWADLPRLRSTEQKSSSLNAPGAMPSPLCVLSESAVLRHERCASPWCSPPGSAAEPPSACPTTLLLELTEQFFEQPGSATWAEGAGGCAWAAPPSSGDAPRRRPFGDSPTTASMVAEPSFRWTSAVDEVPVDHSHQGAGITGQASTGLHVNVLLAARVLQATSSHIYEC